MMPDTWDPSPELQSLAVAMQCGDFTEAMAAEFDVMLRDERACQWYCEFCLLDAELRFLVAADRARNATYDAGERRKAASPSPVLTFTGNTAYGTRGYFLQSWPMAYLVAAVIVGAGLLMGSLVPTTSPVPQITDHSLPPSAMAVAQQGEFVGRITGMVDCQWDDASTATIDRTYVPLGRRYGLASGLMEITYNTGARVILQGPCSYEVESKDGGYLSAGRLTARIEKRGERIEDRGEGSALFSVRTPTAMVTDLGTEFGVRVAADQSAEVCVFDGTVEVVRSASSTGSKTANAPQRLVANEAIRIEAEGDNKPLAVEKVAAAFVRKLPTPHVPVGLERGLVAYWSFDDATNPGRNATGGGDLTSIGSASSEPAGLLGGALRLHKDSKDDTLVFNGGQGVPKGVPTGDASYSISAWYRLDDMPIGGSFDIVGWGEPTFSRTNALFVYGESAEQCMLRNYWWDNDDAGLADRAATIGGWHHLVSTYNRLGRMQYFYLDGVRIALRAIEQRPDFAAANFSVGRRFMAVEYATKRVEGLLDEIGIWNRELFEPEIFQLYNKGRGLSPLNSNASAAENGSRQVDSTSTKGGEKAATGR